MIDNTLKLLLTTFIMTTVDGFGPCLVPRSSLMNRLHLPVETRLPPLWYVITDLPDVSEINSSEMKRELESYGVSTKSLFDKTELEKALVGERIKREAIGVQEVIDRVNNLDTDPTQKKEQKTTWGKSRANPKNKRKNVSRNESTEQVPSKDTRDQKYSNAFQEAIAMKLNDLKQELKDRGISTHTFFEKVEMAKAYAEAVADNVFRMKENKSSTRTTDTKTYYGTSQQTTTSRDGFDPSYRDVNVTPFNAGMTILPGDTVIDITDFVKGSGAAPDIPWQ